MGGFQPHRWKIFRTSPAGNVAKRRLDACPEIFDKRSINWDGSVSACCGDYDNQLIVGDLNQETLKEIFHGEKIQKIRKILAKTVMTGCRYTVTAGNILICKNREIYLNFVRRKFDIESD